MKSQSPGTAVRRNMGANRVYGGHHVHWRWNPLDRTRKTPEQPLAKCKERKSPRAFTAQPLFSDVLSQIIAGLVNLRKAECRSRLSDSCQSNNTTYDLMSGNSWIFSWGLARRGKVLSEPQPYDARCWPISDFGEQSAPYAPRLITHRPHETQARPGA